MATNPIDLESIIDQINRSSNLYKPCKIALKVLYPDFLNPISRDNKNYVLKIKADKHEIDNMVASMKTSLAKKFPQFLAKNSEDTLKYMQESKIKLMQLGQQIKTNYITKIKNHFQTINTLTTISLGNIEVLKESNTSNPSNEQKNIIKQKKPRAKRKDKREYKNIQNSLQQQYPNFKVNGSNDQIKYSREIEKYKKSKKEKDIENKKENEKKIEPDQSAKKKRRHRKESGSLELKNKKIELKIKYPKFKVNGTSDQKQFSLEYQIFKESTEKTESIKVKEKRKFSGIEEKKIFLQKKYPQFKVNGTKDQRLYSLEIQLFRDGKEYINPRSISSCAQPTTGRKSPIHIDSNFIYESYGQSLACKIMEYLPEDIGLLGCELKEIPKTFDSHRHYIEIFKPILFEELKAQISQTLEAIGHMNENSKTLDLSKVIGFNKLIEVKVAKPDVNIVDNSFNLEFKQDLDPKGKKHVESILGNKDLIFIRITRQNRFYHLFGFVTDASGLVDKKKRKLLNYSHGLIQLIRSNETEEIIQILESSNDINGNLNFQFQIIANLTTFSRECMALEDVDIYDHFNFLMKPNQDDFQKIRDSSNSYSIPPFLREKLKLNDSQLNAIKESLFPTGINLIQGPPGTGKTSVIISLISIFLAVIPNCKILVSAPSHTAVDEVARRIIKNQIYNDKGILFKPKMVRTGRIELVSEDIHDICLNKDPFMTHHAKRTMLISSQIILSTLAGAGSNFITDNIEPDVIIVDESTQSCETTTIIPFSLSDKIILIGDPVQLPPTVISNICERFNFDRSLFERLAFEIPRSLLDVQYRMHPLISKFPSNEFYEGAIKDGENVQLYNQPFYNNPKYKALNFYDIIDSKEESIKKSIKNTLEIKLVFALIKKLVQEYPTTKSMSWGIITPYKLQKKEINETKKTFNEAMDIQVNTVDGFQGGEKDIIIFSCVRQSRIGFLGDRRRINVGITRAKYGLFIIGNLNLLSKDKTWRNYTQYITKSNSSFNRINQNGIIVMENEIQKFDIAHPEGLVTYDDDDDEDDDEDQTFLRVPYVNENSDDETDSDDSDDEVSDEEIIGQMESMNLESNADKLFLDILKHQKEKKGNVNQIVNYTKLLSEFDNSAINMKLSNELNIYLDNLYKDNLIDQQNINLKLNNFKRVQSILSKVKSTKSVEIFGSSLHNISMNSGDVDVCLFTSSTDPIEETSHHLKKNGYRVNAVIRSAKVPIIKFTDSNKISYDLSFNRSNGILNSYLMKHYSLIDKRSKQLMLLIKLWAKNKNINDASQHTLSSYSYLNMVIYYLQNIQPPVLPNFQDKGKKLGLKELKDDKFFNQEQFKSKNQLQISQLFYGFFYFYSRFNFKNQLISIRLGVPSPIRMASNQFQNLYSKKSICIEDPFDINYNIGKGVISSSFKKLMFEFCKVEYQIRAGSSYQEIFN